jgi:hypothetical protein
MGFYFDEFEKDKKQHINLSDSAWMIIEQDIKNFYLSESEESKSGFLNIILSNFYESAEASISIRHMNKIDEITEMFNAKSFIKIDEKIKKELIQKISDEYQFKLIEKAKNYPKGRGQKFRINVSNVELLKNDIQEESFYDDSIGLYLKALFEEYTIKQSFEREMIFFKSNIDEIRKAIYLQKKLKLTIKQKYNIHEKKWFSRKFYVTPYKITQESSKNYNYLVCYSEEISHDGTIGDKIISSFRISRIEKIMVMKSMGGFLSNEKRNELEHEIMQKQVQFMAGDLIDIKIKFTQKGLENLNRQLYMRPSFYKKVKDEERTYIFHCTEIQAINYFIKFLRDIEILSPLSLREKFIQRYNDALNVYIKTKH